VYNSGVKLFPNRDNNRIARRFAGCIVTGGALSVLFSLYIPHFPGWPAIGPAAVMLLVATFVIPEISRQRP
jgi:hypothetical protein